MSEKLVCELPGIVLGLRKYHASLGSLLSIEDAVSRFKRIIPTFCNNCIFISFITIEMNAFPGFQMAL